MAFFRSTTVSLRITQSELYILVLFSLINVLVDGRNVTPYRIQSLVNLIAGFIDFLQRIGERIQHLDGWIRIKVKKRNTWKNPCNSDENCFEMSMPMPSSVRRIPFLASIALSEEIKNSEKESRASMTSGFVVWRFMTFWIFLSSSLMVGSRVGQRRRIKRKMMK